MNPSESIIDREQIDRLLGAESLNPLKLGILQDTKKRLPSTNSTESNYQVFVVEEQSGGRAEIHKLQRYQQSHLQRVAQKPAFKFRFKCNDLLKEYQAAEKYDDQTLELESASAALWSKIALLSDHLGASDESDELIAALQTAHAQFAKRTTPHAVFKALLDVLRVVSDHGRLTTGAVDSALDALEAAGIDLNFPLSFGNGSLEKDE